MMQAHEIQEWSPEAFSLKGKVALVTGGNTGLGQSYVLAFAKAGANVFIATEDENWDETDALLADTGVEYAFYKANLMDDEEKYTIIPTCVERFGGIDILVNNAGIMRINPPEAYTDKDWRDIFSVHVDGTFSLSREAAKVMIEQGRGGKIINICSLMAFRGDPISVGYTACKHAIAGITKSCAVAWGQYGISVNAIAPGFIKTAGNPPDMGKFAEGIPVGRLGVPYDLMGLVVYLASPASDFLTGQIIAIDGAWLQAPLTK